MKSRTSAITIIFQGKVLVPLKEIRCLHLDLIGGDYRHSSRTHSLLSTLERSQLVFLLPNLVGGVRQIIVIVCSALKNTPLVWLIFYFTLMSLTYRFSKRVHPNRPTLQLLLFTHSYLARFRRILPSHVLFLIYCEPTVKLRNYFSIARLFTRCLVVLH